ncbi:MAG: antitoxin [Acidobacteriota bacterium]|nr:antitoxin [Acidobacteriota bacterium]
MRTTITLDEDVAAKLRSEMHRGGRSFKETVNDVLRRGLNARQKAKPTTPFVVRARPLELRPGLSYDNIGELLEQLEGAGHR